MQLVNTFKSAAQGYGTERRVLLLHGPVGSSKSTIARLLKRGLEEYSPHRRRACSSASPGRARTAPGRRTRCTSEPLQLVPQEHRAAAAGAAQRAAARSRRLRGPASRATSARSAGYDVQRAAGQVRRRLARDARRRGQGLPPDPVRAGPHRHRHLPAEGREEPGLDRADRRHQLPQDRRVRHRQRPAGVQLRRRAEHRQPRPRRVHRGAEARRGVPLRPARRVAGAQDQAEEVRPDRHRRGHPRAHQRAGVPPAAEQRVHGGAARPHGEDRRPVRHPAAGRDQDLREGLQPGAGAGQAHRPAHRSRSRPCGRC